MKHHSSTAIAGTLVSLGAAGSLLLLASCSSSSSAPNFLKKPIFMEKPHLSLVEPRAVVPGDFLFSFHEPYNEWMDTPHRVYYHKVPLNEVFHRKPFTKLVYTLGEMPRDMPLISIDALGITRRQLLWMLAHDNQLKMSLISDEAGHPMEIIIRWRGTEPRNRGIVDPTRLREAS